MELFAALFAISSLMLYHVGLLTLFYHPLALWYEARRLLPRRQPLYWRRQPLVSIVVPAYNEGPVLDRCIRSILACAYPFKELILVDDGSTDDTLTIMRRYERHPRVKVIARPNGGKASALNTGLRRAQGEVLFFVDADGLFREDTIDAMLAGFEDTRVGAVCGNDAPVNLDRIQTRLLCLLSHVGTGFVRRALSVINCLPIVSGNIGAFRREALEQAGPFREGCIGEDLELTWRIHRAGYRVVFQPRALVYAESPSTVPGLWKQRVRWARGLLQTAWLHRDMFFRPRYGPIAFFLALNVVSMAFFPLVQLGILTLLPLLALAGALPLRVDLLALIGWLGLGVACFTLIVALILDRAWRDLRFLYVVPLWIPYSIFLCLVAGRALFLELRRREARWNKLERTGVVSRR